MKNKCPVLRNFVILLVSLSYQGFAVADQGSSLEAKAKQIVLGAAQFLKNAGTMTFKGMATSQEVSASNEKFQFDSMVEGAMIRPNKFFLKKTGYERVALWFDGKTLSILDSASAKYARISLPGDIPAVSSKLDEIGIETPFSALLDPDIGNRLSKSGRSAKYMGETMILGTSCDHVAVRQSDVDWQIWVDKRTSAPKKIVITSKMVTSAPEYTLLLTELNTGVSIPDATFTFAAPTGAQEVPILKLGDASSANP